MDDARTIAELARDLVRIDSRSFVSNVAIEHFARQLRVSSLLTIDGARHEILQEADFYREQFFAAFDAFIPGTNAPVA